ncbi:MAG TPA: glycosyltransferase family 4 protein [Planctomycetota bacterium]|nr:glycosyltransferase family 4 protein [Planctomycetota bacterium]
MRIAQVAPLYESVPPQFYGGTERIISYLTEELVRRGHEVTLFASGDSRTAARLRPACERSLRLDPECQDSVAHHLLMLEQVAREASDFDLVHYHVDYLHFPMTRRIPQRHLTTLHGRLDIPDLVPLYREFRDVPLVSISDAQREPLRWANWQGTIYHGLPEDLYPFQEQPGSYLAFLGRISPEKGCHQAIDIALQSGMPIKIAAKIGGPADRDYFEAMVRPLLSQPGVEFLGEISDREKASFLGGARALLFPISWPEPFGLVMIEALACGTPVLAFPCGSVPEILEPGVTAEIGRTIPDLVSAVGRLDEIDRAQCRQSFERRFSSARMREDYEQLYERVMSEAGSWMK